MKDGGPLQLQVFPYSEPQSAANAGRYLLAWLYDDPARLMNNRTLAAYAWYDGTNWSGPKAIHDDGTADFHPHLLVFPDGSAAAAWENGAVVLPDSAGFETIKTNLEVCAAFYDPAAGRWGVPHRFSTNSFLDRSPKLAGVARTDVIAVWVANADSHLTGTATNANEILSARWNGVGWSAPATVAVLAQPMLKYDWICNGTAGWLVFAADGDGDLATVNDRELYRIGWQDGVWSAVERLTTDNLLDDNPQLAFDQAGHCVLAWVKGTEVCSTVDFDLARRTLVRAEAELTSNLADFKLSMSAEGRLLLLWAEPTDYTSDLKAMFYDPLFQLWSTARQENPAPGDAVTFEFEVMNSGDSVVTNAVVAFYLGEPAGGLEIGRTNLDLLIPAGTSISGRFIWEVPATNAPLSISAVVDPDQTLIDAHRLNNLASITVVKPELGIESISWSRLGDKLLSVTAHIGNQGVIRSAATSVRFALGGQNGEILHAIPVGALDPGQSVDVNFLWDVSLLATNVDLWAGLPEDVGQSDFDPENNSAVLRVARVLFADRPVLGPVEMLPGGVFQFTVRAEVGLELTIESSTDLQQWTPVGALQSTNALMNVIDQDATNAVRRFYRVFLR